MWVGQVVEELWKSCDVVEQGDTFGSVFWCSDAEGIGTDGTFDIGILG